MTCSDSSEPGPGPGAGGSPGDALTKVDAPTSVDPLSNVTHGVHTLRSLQPGKPDDSPPAPILEPALPPSGFAIERLVHGAEIARGGMATIGEAFDTKLLRRVAVKRLRDQAEFDLRARFFEEAQVTAQLDHPNVVSVHDVFGEPGTGQVFFTMKLVEGHTLGQVIDELHRHPLTPERLHPVLQAFIKVCDAVSFAHSRRVVHRDLKPDNVMVGTHGQVYVMDWGVARLLSPTSELASAPFVRVQSEHEPSRDAYEHAIVGTPDYMAPEQAQGQAREIDERTDIFGLGGILYYLLTGLGPYSRSKSGCSLAQRGDVDPPEEHGVWPRLPPGLCQITMKALAPGKHQRFQSVDELRQSVDEFLQGGGWFATQRFHPGELIVSEGEVGESAYIITEGQCQVFRIENDEKHELRVLGPGEVFGETAVLTRKPRTASVVAVSEVTVKVVTRASLENELSRNPWLDAFVRSLAERFREVDAEVASHRRSRTPSSKEKGQSG